MNRGIPRLIDIEDNRNICENQDYEFLYQLQRALLLALREQGRLSPMQHRQAEEKLRKQRCDRARQKQEKP